MFFWYFTWTVSIIIFILLALYILYSFLHAFVPADMDLLKVFQQAHEHANHHVFPFRHRDDEIENLKQIIMEKDVIINNDKERLQELEENVTASQQKQKALEALLNKMKDYGEVPIIMDNYEDLLAKVMEEREIIVQEKETALTHLANLELAFSDLLEKYERTKTIVSGYQQNEEALIKHVENYEDAVNCLEQRYDDFKNYAKLKLNEANAELDKTDKRHIAEMAKLKTKILQSQVQICDLEKQLKELNITPDSLKKQNSKSHLFMPLTNKF